MKTGTIEVSSTELRVLSEAQTPPFLIQNGIDTREDLRLRYRYLDLRRPELQHKIMFRAAVVEMIRRFLSGEGFLDIETPTLIKSTPEGARDYLVPSRVHPGEFYALPQSPQLLKQLLMCSGMDRYYQIARCYRDEDLRADRQPEFTQVDMELSFVDQDDVIDINTRLLTYLTGKMPAKMRELEFPEDLIKGIEKAHEELEAHGIGRITWQDAMDFYGSDKPDLRIDLEIQDVTAAVAGSEFGPFQNATVKAVTVHDFDQARKWIDKLLADVEVQTGNKACWIRVDENGELTGGVSKFLTEQKDALTAALGLKPGSFVCLAAGKKSAAQKTAGVIRTLMGKRIPGHFDEEQYAMCWIVDFPMYEMGYESGQLEFCHNPFSMPQGGMQTLLDAEGNTEKLLAINADQYDLVVNGYESASGAVRNHDPEIMVKAFQMVGLGEEDVKAKFPAMYNAFTYGAPPHAGAAPGVDRLVMLLTGEESIREVITFPMNKTAQDLMMDAPTTVSQKQLDDVHILINEEHLK